MKKYAILKNVHRGINFGVVVKSDGLNHFYGWSDKGIEWSDWANRNKLGLSDLPAGVSVGEFKNLSDEMSAKIVAGSLDMALAFTPWGARGNRQLLLKSARYSNVSKYPGVTGKKIPDKQGNKKTVVSYKAKSFQQSVARSEIGLKVRTNELAFNYETKQFNPKPSRTSQMAERYAVQQKMSKGQERKFGAQIIKLINKDIVVKENIQIVKREQIGQRTKEIVDFFVKSRLGYAIGRAVRGATPNRRRSSMRGMASRAISGVLDPRTRRDVDGDGMIFDGTWREMPDPTRFKPSAPDPNKPIGSQSLQIIEDNKRRQAEMSRIFERTSRGMQESIRGRGRGLSSRAASSSQPPNKPPQVRKLMALDPKNSDIAKKITYDPYDGELTVSYNDGRVESFNEVTYPRVYEAGKNDNPDKLIFELEKEQNKKLSSQKRISRGLSSQTGKPFAPDPNKPIGSQSLQIIEDNKKRQADMSRILQEASRGVQESIRKRGRGLGSRTAFVDKKKPRSLNSTTKQSIEDAIGFMDSVNAGGADWDSGLRKAWEADGANWSNSGDLVSAVTAKLSALLQQDDFKKADPKNKQKLIKNLVDGVASDLAKDETERYPSNVLNALSEYINGVASDRDVNAAQVIAAFDPDGNKSSRANALEATVASALGKLGETSKDRQKYLDNRGRATRFGGLIDDITQMAEGAREPELQRALQKIAKGMSVSGDEQSELLETLQDMADNNETFQNDDRLAELIDDVKRMSSSANDDDRQDIIKELQDAMRGTAEPEFARNLQKFSKGDLLSDKERASLLESLNDVLDNNNLFENDRRLQELIEDVSSPISKVKKEITQSFASNQEGGDDLDSGLRRVAERQGLKKSTTNELAALLYDVAQSPKSKKEIDSKINQIVENSTDREIMKAVFERFSELNDSGKKRRGLSSSTGEDDDDLGSDLSDAIDAINKLKEGKKLSADEINAILTTVDNLDMTRIGDEDQRIAIMDLRNQARRQGALRSSTSPGGGSDDDLGSDLDDAITAINKAKNGEKLTKDEIRAVLTMVNNIDMTRIDDEDDRIALMDLKNQVLKQSSLSSSTTPRRRPVSQATSSRIATATTERASRPRGLGSTTTLPETRTEVEKSKSKPRRNIYFSQILKDGGVKRQDGDGVLWESMSEEDRTKTKEAIAAEKARIVKDLKTRRFKQWWQKATEEGLDKQSLRAVRQRARGTGGRQKVRPDDDPLTKDDAREMMQILDTAVSKGKVEKFEKDKKTGEYVLDKQGRPKLTEAYRAQRLLEDLVTILNMEENDDFSLLEHFHSGTRQKISKAVGTPATRKFSNVGEDSSIFKEAGGIAKAASVDELNPEETGKKKKQALGKRLLRVNEARAARARQRAMRRTGGFRKGRILTVGDPALELKRARLRTRAMKRRMLSNFRRNRDADELAKDLGKIKAETSTVVVDNKGTLKIKPRFVDVLAKLDDELRRAKDGPEKDRDYDQLLADLWENNGYSDVPTLVNEDEVRRLLAAGWQPVIRGTGHQQVESEGFVEQFLTNETARFIPGQGMRAYGIGEYFAYPGTWMTYSGSRTDKHSMLVLVPPSADVATTGEMKREYAKMRDLATRLVDVTKTMGGRDAAEKMSAGELAVEFRKAIPNLTDETSRSGQIINQLVGRLEELDKDPGDTSQERKKILGAVDYLFRFTKQNIETDFGYLAPIIGVDAIDTNGSPGEIKNPFLIHNRTGIAAYQIPVTRDEAERLAKASDGSKIGAIWHTWANRTDRSREGAEIIERPRTGRKRRPSTRRPDPDDDSTPPAPPPQDAPKISKSAVNTDTWSRSTPQNVGSNPATMLTDPNGTKYYTKLKKPSETSAQAAERMETEVLAAKLYDLAGVPVADLQMGTNNGEPVMLSRMIQTRMPNLASDKVEAQKGFVADAWLANWDAPLNDNIKIDNNGRAVRLDVGGSLDYRAQGAKKGSQGTTAFGNSVGEMTTLQKRGGNVDFSNMDKDVLKKQAQKLGTITDDDIRKTVQAIVSDPARAKVLADTLIARRDDIMKKYG